MIALISLFTNILRISAITYNRSRTREEIAKFLEEFEKDLRNASQVGDCSGSIINSGPGEGKADFSCQFVSDSEYTWQACPKPADLPEVCSATDFDCQPGSNTICKVLNDGTVVSKLNYFYNLEQFGVTSFSGGDDGRNKTLAVAAVISHPNNSLKINNIVRQSIVTTKNFETNVKAP